MKMKPLEPVQSGSANVTPIRAPSSDNRTEQLMPYEKAAKTIFVRANGLPAYHRATGQVRRLTDGDESETK